MILKAKQHGENWGMREDKKQTPFSLGLYIEPQMLEHYSRIVIWGRKVAEDGFVNAWTPLWETPIDRNKLPTSGLIETCISLEPD